MNKTSPDDRIDRACEWQRRGDQACVRAEYVRAERWLRHAHRLIVSELDAGHPDSVNIGNALAAVLEVRGDLAGAEMLLRDSAAGIGAIAADLEAVHLIRIQTWQQLGGVLRLQGRYADAGDWLRRALADSESTLGAAHPQTGAVLNNLAVLLKYTGGFDEAAALYDRALRLALAGEPPDEMTIATLYHNIGGLAHARGTFAEGEEPARRAHEIRLRVLGPDHPEVAADAAAWAGLLEGLGRFDEARAIYGRALAIYRTVYGEEHPEVAYALSALANAEAGGGRHVEAEAHYREAVARRERLFGPDHPDVGLTLHNYARLLTDMGRVGDARAAADRASQIFAAHYAEGHPKIRAAAALLAELA